MMASGRVRGMVALAALIAAGMLVLGAAGALAADRDFTLRVENKRIDIGSGLSYDAWTYGGTVPGPLLRATVGDKVTVHLVNDTEMAHGLDIHAAGVAPSKHFAAVAPKTGLNYSFVAEVPGAFMYHCSAAPMLNHIANGMYGMMIVDPKGRWPAAHEVTIEQGEYYGDPDKNGVVSGDSKRMMDERPDFVVFNGKLEQYVEHPIQIKVGELVRIFFVNAGPNRLSTFHVVGTILSAVYRSGNPANALHDVQSFEVGPGDGAIFEFRVHEAGDYPFVDHAIARAYKGAIGMFHAVP
ncbi:MAG: multicopper oxidase domain-containing protein [Candidatus Binatus sp.]|jgi:nitrite reductase (NO-forming)